MKNRKPFVRFFSVVLILIMGLNLCDLEALYWIFSIKEAYAASAISPAEVTRMWNNRKTEVGVTLDNKPQLSFWKDTGDMYTNWIDTSVHTELTKSDDLPNKTLGVPIAKAADGDVYTVRGASVASYPFMDNVATGGAIWVYDNPSDKDDTLMHKELSNDYLVNEIPLNPKYGESGDAKELPYYYTVEKDDALGGYYRRYYISTANQLQYLLFVSLSTGIAVKNEVGDTIDDINGNNNAVHGDMYIKTTKKEIMQYFPQETNGTVLPKLGIELLCDIDLGGAESQYWVGYSNANIITELNGNNHTIYNGYFIKVKTGEQNKTTNSKDVTTATNVYRHYTFFNGQNNNNNSKVGTDENGNFVTRNTFTGAAQKFALKNVDFSNIFLDREGGIFGNSVSRTYLENVNFQSSISTANASSSAICFGNSYLYSYFKNCMIRNCYVYSAGGHSAAFASYNGGMAYSNYGKRSTYIGDPNPSKDVNSYYFKDVPELKYAEAAWQSTLNSDSSKDKFLTAAVDGVEYPLTYYYPSIYENCMTIDSEVYDAGGEHSGTFVSCMQSGIVFKNCFTNSTIYAQTKAGCFIGMCIGSADGFQYEVEGEKSFVNAYFENCYSSGLIEGQSKEGGFIGSIFNGDARNYDMDSSTATNYRGKCVFKDCYSTTSVGMQYSSATEVGGFVGGIIGNGLALNDEDKQHIFINCYAAGEVGGIETNTSTDSSNTGSIGGFMGEYVEQTYTAKDNGLVTKFTERIEPVVKNCYYDKQTTAMRERDIGSKSADLTLCNTLDGLKGVYTLSSSVKNVAGLADTVKFGDGAWVYQKGYYPELGVFMGEKAKANFGDKAQTAELYSRASVATVFLDHWDSIMDRDGNIGKTDLTTVYDTVRDISYKFEFSSGGNSAVGNIGWQHNTEKNEQSGFSTYLGGETRDTDGNIVPNGFGVDFGYTAKDGSDANMVKQYAPEVLSIMAEKETNGDYSFKCFDFAAGKQFVKVTTCTDADYEKWKNDQEKYDNYLLAVDEFNLARPKYIKILGLEAVTTNDEKIRELINIELRKLLKLSEDAGESEIGARLDYVTALVRELSSDESSVKYNAARELNDILELGHSVVDDTAIQNIYSNCTQFLQYNVYPYVEPAEVKAPEDFKSYVTGRFGTRTLRLVPTAYLDAGDMITINVNSNVESGNVSDISNEVSMTVGNKNYSMNKFDHTLGVIYSSTQGYPNSAKGVTTRLGDNSLYEKQKIAKNSTDYYNHSKGVFNANLNTDEIFALYDYYPSRKAEDIGGTTVDGGFITTTPQVLLGNFCIDDGGLTKVEVYKTVTNSVGDSGSFVLDKGEKINMSDSDNLEKWTGQTNFDTEDKGYYYMVYYWRMSDGRYLEEYKLVKITANKFTVQMRSGVAGDTEDSFVYNADNEIYYTAIDCDIFSDYDNSKITDAIKRHYFPSDRYYYPHKNGKYKDWADFAEQAYDEYDKYLDYNEGSYWYKAITTSTAANSICVAWRKSADYALVKLMVEVYNGGKWIPMAISGNDSEHTSIGDEDYQEYYYSYKSYDVTQNPRTKLFSVITTDNVVKTFGLSDVTNTDHTGSSDYDKYQNIGAGAVRYINFQFFDETATDRQLEFNDDIRVTALFRKVDADVRVTESVLIDDGRSEDEIVEADGEYIALDKADAYRSVDNYNIEQSEKRAVLFGDKLIYRLKVQNAGHYNANNIIIKQKLPSGLTWDENMEVKLYKQERTINTNSEDVYQSLTPVTLENISDDEYNSSYKSEQYSYCVERNDGETWFKYRLNPVSMTTDYYIQIECNVDKNYNKQSEHFENNSDYGFVFVNGDVDENAEDIGDLNQNYAENAIYNLSSTESVDDNKNISYDIVINKQKNLDKTHYITNIYNTLPDGYSLVDGSFVVDIPGLELNKDYKINFMANAISISAISGERGYVLSGDESISIKYKLRYDGVTANDKVENTINIQYVPSTNDHTQYQNSLTMVTKTTNTVEADAKWLYLNVEKTIDNPDPVQSFLFKVEDITAANNIFADVICSEKIEGVDKTYYRGNKVIQIGERGLYRVNETDWANTDYDIDKAAYTSEDIDLSNIDTSGEDRPVIQESIERGFYLPRAMYRSGAFPFAVSEQQDSDGNTEIVYPTVSCHNVESEYAWLSDQKYVENNVSDESSAGTGSRNVPLSGDKTATPPAVVVTEPVKVKKEDDKKE